MTIDGDGDDLDIPEALKRTGSKVPEAVKSEVQMSDVDAAAEAPVKAKPRKAAAKANGAGKAPAKVKAAPKAKKAASKAPKAKAKPRKAPDVALDAYGYREGSLKSKAMAMYASKQGATLAEVKAKLKVIQLNCLMALDGKRGYKIVRVKEEGPGPRKLTRYFLKTK